MNLNTSKSALYVAVIIVAGLLGQSCSKAKKKDDGSSSEVSSELKVEDIADPQNNTSEEKAGTKAFTSKFGTYYADPTQTKCRLGDEVGELDLFPENLAFIFTKDEGKEAAFTLELSSPDDEEDKAVFKGKMTSDFSFSIPKTAPCDGCFPMGFTGAFQEGREILVDASIDGDNGLVTCTMILIAKRPQQSTGVAQPRANGVKRIPVQRRERDNIMYLGIDNRIRISKPGLDASTLSITSDKKDVEITAGRAREREYFIKPHTAGEFSIRITGPEIDQTETYKAIHIPDPKVGFLVAGNEITRSRLWSKTKVYAWMGDFKYDVECNVTEFVAVYKLADGTVKTFAAKSDKLTSEMRNMLPKLRAGDHVILKNIKVQRPDYKDPVPHEDVDYTIIK